MNSRRIVILTSGPLARNPRVLKEANTLGGAGYQVTVLGVRSHRPSIDLDAELTRGAPFVHEQIELLDGPIAWLRRARIRGAREWLQRFGFGGAATLGPAHALLAAARRIPADLFIVHTEPALWAGVRLLNAGRRVAADFEDWHSEDLPPEARAIRPMQLLRKIECELLHRAVYVTTTSEGLAARLHQTYGGTHPRVIYNAFPLGPLPADPLTDTRSAIPSLIWFSQTVGPGRGLEPFLDAWARCAASSNLMLLGTVSDSYRAQLLGLVPARKQPFLQFHALVPPSTLPNFLTRYDLGLALETTAIGNKDLTISNKILQYLNASLAVIATPTAGQREVMNAAPAAGILDAFTDPAASARRLDGLLVDPVRLAEMRLAARRAAEDHFCWEHMSGRLLELVDHALAPRP